jgi:hypothetical protein
MEKIVSTGSGEQARTGNLADEMREDVCEHCAFSHFPAHGSHGDCRANPPTPVVIVQMQRDLVSGQTVPTQAIQTVFPPIERRTFCYTFEPRTDTIED